MNNTSNTEITTYQILTDTNSALYTQCKQEVEEGKKDNPIWNKIRITDWYIDKCFDDINSRLHHVPGSINKGKTNLSMADAYSSVFMVHEQITINLRKDIIRSSGDPVLYIDCIPGSENKKISEPLYLTDIVKEYNAKPLNKQ